MCIATTKYFGSFVNPVRHLTYPQVHQDCIEEHGQRFQGLRILTALVYLNDVEAGGGTNFPEIGKVGLQLALSFRFWYTGSLGV